MNSPLENLFIAVVRCRPEAVKTHLEEGVDPNRMEHDQTLLSAAVLTLPKKKGKPEVVRLLLEAGANPNLQDENGFTPLHYVVSQHSSRADFHIDIEIIRMLLEAGADPTLLTKNGKSPKDLCSEEFYLNRLVEAEEKHLLEVIPKFLLSKKDEPRL